MKNKISLQDKLKIIEIQIDRLQRLGNIAETTTHYYFFDRCVRCNSALNALKDNGETDSLLDEFFNI